MMRGKPMKSGVTLVLLLVCRSAASERRGALCTRAHRRPERGTPRESHTDSEALYPAVEFFPDVAQFCFNVSKVKITGNKCKSLKRQEQLTKLCKYFIASFFFY